MPTKNPRINVVLEEELYGAISELADRNGMSVSTTARGLLKEAMEFHEDSLLAEMADARRKNLGKRKLLSHAEVWGS